MARNHLFQAGLVLASCRIPGNIKLSACRRILSENGDVDARWTKKNNETYYGYKNHIFAPEANKLVQDYAVTDAAVHASI